MEDSILIKQDRTVGWLLGHESAGVRYRTLRDILDRPETDPEVVAARDSIVSWGPVAEYLKEQHHDGFWGFAEDVYWPKWNATVWALILLGELGVPGNNPSIRAGCEYFLKTISEQDRSWPPPKYAEDDLRSWRLCWEPCVTGNMARTLAVFGYGKDPRVQEMFEWLVKNQRDDGGWNCDTEDSRNGEPVHHSSFMSTIEPLWAFSSLAPQHWPKGAKEKVERGVEFLLLHKLFKSDKTGKVIREEWTQLHFPMFYFYDILHGLRVVSSLGYGSDERIHDALELLKSKRLADGTWTMEASFLRALRRNFVKDPSTGNWHQDVDSSVDASKIYTIGSKVARIPRVYDSLGRPGQPNPWVTLNALRVFKNTDGLGGLN